MQVYLCKAVPPLPSQVAGLVFPNHVYSPPGGIFCPRPLHVAVLAQDFSLAKLLLRAALETRCDGDVVFLRSHTPTTNWGEMSPIFLALLVVEPESLADWLDLLCSAGARLNHMDWHIYGVIQEVPTSATLEREKAELQRRLQAALERLHRSAARRRIGRKQRPPELGPRPPEASEEWA